MEDLISVIIPVYNVGRYLKRCIESVWAQTYSNIEIILVDDGSTDDSGAICDHYAKQDQRIKVLHQDNQGQSAARNAGLDVACGEYIGFVDSDDWIHPDMYAHLYKALIKYDAEVANLKCVFAYKDTMEVTAGPEHLKTYHDKEALRMLMCEGTVGIPAAFGVCRGLYKRRLLEGLKFEEGRINEDIVFCYRVYERVRRLVVSDMIGYFYFTSVNSTTRNGLKKKDFDLLWACGQLAEMSKTEKFKDIKYLVLVKQARSYFSLLAKIAYYGIADPSLDERKTVKDLTSLLRKNFFLLMGSPVPLARKFLILLLCIHINLLKYPLVLYRNYLKSHG